jgi:hypothetical protein
MNEINGFGELELYEVRIESKRSLVQELFLDIGQDLSIRRVSFNLEGILYSKYVYFEDKLALGYVFGSPTGENFAFDSKRFLYTQDSNLIHPAFNDINPNNPIESITVTHSVSKNVKIFEELDGLNYWGTPQVIIQSTIAA